MRSANLILFVGVFAFAKGQSSPFVEYLQNFNHPALGNAIPNLIEKLLQPPKTNFSRSYSLPFQPTETHNFTYTKWTDYGSCSKVCGGGARVRTRSCVDEQGKKHPVVKCIDMLRTQDLLNVVMMGGAMEQKNEELCNKQDCGVTEWTGPTTCSRKCGSGVKTYSRKCLDSEDQLKCNFQSKLMEPCNTVPCFRLAPWDKWSTCTKKCGIGRKSRSRKCVPNVPEYSELYSELKTALDHVSKPGVLTTVEHPDEIFYFTQYVTSCASQTIETQFCNLQPCPRCLRNQVWHDCLPCKKYCKKVDMSNLSELNVDLSGFYSGYSGCGGTCAGGCGCPAHLPLLGSDGACYMFDMLCPINGFSPYQVGNNILQNIISGLPQVNLPNRGSVHTANASDIARIISGDAAASLPPVTLPPSPSIGIGSPSGQNNLPIAEINVPSAAVIPSSALPVAPYKTECPYDILIVKNNFCECKGIAEVTACFTDLGSSCPIICKRSATIKKACPDPRSPRVKSNLECGNALACIANTDCPTSHTCCQLHCGQRCIKI